MYQDSVTGLPILESFLHFFEKIWKTSSSNRYAILSVNIGSFRKVNQQYNYMQGNVLLSLFAQRLVRNSQYLLSACRVEADLFLLLLDLHKIGLSQVESYIRDIFSDFYKHISCLYPDIPLSFQIGVCLLSDDIHTLDEAIDCAVYARKSLEFSLPASSNILIAFYKDALLGKANCEHRILPLFEDIMSTNHLLLYLQPKVELESSNTIGAETLVRILDHHGHPLKPDSFLSILEKYNLTFELDLLVIESMLRLIQHWQSIGLKPLPVSVNLSEKDFMHPSFMQILKELIDKYPSSHDFLEFEIPESSISHNPDYMIEVIHALHELGCRVILDGFGRDLLSFTTLGIPPVDAVKFHRSILDTSMRNEQNRHILKGFAEMFEECQIPVICQGVESSIEETFVRECNIRFAQGYYYGRPVPPDLFEKKHMLYRPIYI